VAFAVAKAAWQFMGTERGAVNKGKQRDQTTLRQFAVCCANFTAN